MGRIYVSDSNQNIEATCMFKLKLTELNGFMSLMKVCNIEILKL